MADYKGIHGGKVQNFSTNPPTPIIGQVWYNETTRTLNYHATSPAGAWSTGGNLNTGRAQLSSATRATQGASLAFGGTSTATHDVTESYNGSTWTEVADLNTAAYSRGGAGITTSAIAYGGLPPGGATANAETWNGSTWTEVGNLNTARYHIRGTGATNTAVIAASGRVPGTNYSIAESFNGTSWTEVGDLNTGKGAGCVAGILTAAIYFGGSPTITADTESWNGSSWTEVNNLNTARAQLGGAGLITAALAMGGESAAPAATAVTESWNGTSWTEVNDLSTARRDSSGSGTSTAGLAFGGSQDPGAATEEWDIPSTVTKSVDTD
mgnify:CR=1 FL=1